MTGKRRTRAETKAETRRKLLDAAFDVFAEKGFHKASVEEIAELAGFTRGAFYANFRDKADLLMTLVERERSAAMHEMVDLVGAADEPEKLPTAQAWYEGINLHPLDRAVTELMAHDVDDDELRARMARQRRVDRDAIAAAMTAYCEGTGLELPVPVERIAAVMLAVGDGLASQRHLDPDAFPASLFGEATIWVWNGVWGGNPPVA